MKAVIIEDETTAVNSLKAILAQNTVTQIEVIAELESIEESVDFFRTSPHPDIIFMDGGKGHVAVPSFDVLFHEQISFLHVFHVFLLYVLHDEFSFH